jgi:A/G-specific adenine glycosylase
MELSEEQTQALRGALLGWFDRHKRDLPWRRTRDAYAIWISEIMLQQTRVAAVLEHYARWMERWPTVAALAAAEEAEVLALWSGLGYYRRARFLHAGARAVVADYGGELPGTAAALRGLAGIGEYTSAAIASIAFGEQVAVVDGNVERVAMRLAGLAAAHIPAAVRIEAQRAAGEAQTPALEPGSRVLGSAALAREIRVLASALLDPERPGDWNQAMMELGATVCLPRAPLCLQCPVRPWCATRGEHAGAPRKAMQSRRMAYALVQRDGRDGAEVLLAQRTAGGSLMPGMWELPELGALPDAGTVLVSLRHSITVTNYRVEIVACSEQQVRGMGAAQAWVPVERLPETALTGLARKVLRRLQLWPEAVAR